MGAGALERAKEGVRFFDTDGDGSVGLAEFSSAIGEEASDNATDEPTEIHLVNHGASVMSFMWTTRASNGSLVQLGRASGSYTQQYEGNWSTYRAGDLYNISSLGFHGKIHTVRAPIEDKTRYFYRVGDGVHWSRERSFQLEHAPTGGEPTRIAWGGDMGTYIPAGWRVAQQMLAAHAASPLHAAVIVGDIAYGTIGVPTMEDEFEFVWDAWFRMMEPLSSEVPTVAVVGNHERPFDFAAFRARFDMDPTHAGKPNFFYAVGVGRVRIVVLSSEDSLAVGSAQRAWLEAELEKNDAPDARARFPWLVVAIHFPVYCSDTFEASHCNVGAKLQLELEPLLLRHHVDLLVAGHHHVYERTSPVANGTVVGPPLPDPPLSKEVYTDPSAPVHLLVGTAGAFYPEMWQRHTPPWSRARRIEYGYSLMEAHNASHLCVRFEPLSGKETSVDEFWIVRTNHEQATTGGRVE